MIAGSAPPTIHHENHEKDGKDEVDCTNLEGAGGLTLPWDDFVYLSAFESLDGYTVTQSGGGAISMSGAQLLLETGGAQWDRYEIRKALNYPPVPLTWNKNKQFVTAAKFSAGGSTNGWQSIGIGNIASNNYLGFRVVNGLFQAVAKTGLGEETFEIADWSAGAYEHQKRLKIVHPAGAGAEFWVDGVKVYTATTRIPEGTYNAQILLHAQVYNTDTGDWLKLYLSFYHYWQEA